MGLVTPGPERVGVCELAELPSFPAPTPVAVATR